MLEWADSYRNGKSVREIAEEFGVNSSRVYRTLRKIGVEFRTNAESQELAFQKGRNTSPTAGRSRTDAEKELIGRALSESYRASSEASKEHRKELGKKTYAAKTQEERESFHKASAKAIRRTSVEGSRLEKFLADKLIGAGYVVETQKQSLILNNELRVDIYLPEKRIAVEVDGISHSKDIYGENAKFLKKKLRDSEKDGLLVSSGYNVIRIFHEKSLSVTRMSEVFNKLLAEIESSCYTDSSQFKTPNVVRLEA